MSQSSNPPLGEPLTAVEAARPAGVATRLPFSALICTAVVAAAAVVVGVVFAPAGFRAPLAIGAGIAAIVLCATVTAAIYYRAEALRARSAAAEASAAAESGLVTANDTIAAANTAAYEAISSANDAAEAHATAARDAESRRSSAMAAFSGAAGRMQAMTTSMLAELREMEHAHADPKVLADLLHLDHRTAQAGRLADSIAVLSGARSGRRWAKPIAMESILRGAMGRVAGYQRVRLRAVAEIAIAGHAAEGVMHALAELIDNACNFSPPTTEVHIYAAEVPAGVVLTIEDSGLVMSESALRRAEAAVSGQGPRGGVAADLSSLTGTRLGLAVVGHLARKHGLTVSYRPSAIGGTAVVVVVPRDLTARVDRGHQTPVAAPVRPAVTQVTTQSSAAQVTEFIEPQQLTATDSALPKRRRGSTLAAVHPDGLSAPRAVADPAPNTSRPAALGAFQRAVARRDAEAAPSPSPSVENDR
ncbi:sensor histidine kinase [Nocardia panacis]|uniref:sensor histidine kinase n=1 Tax=Nocardia panacis TaxID=2340916 RepID=UPI001EEF9185|nr:ATP-binding protein [Nocardia panacis]